MRRVPRRPAGARPRRPVAPARGSRRSSSGPLQAKLATAHGPAPVCESPSVAEVETSREGAVLTITLNRPDVLNAFNTDMHKALAAALKEARSPDVRAV